MNRCTPGCSYKIEHPKQLYADIAWHLQQVSIFHPSGSHIQGTLVACGGWHTQMNIQDLDTSHDLSGCMSSQTAQKEENMEVHVSPPQSS